MIQFARVIANIPAPILRAPLYSVRPVRPTRTLGPDRHGRNFYEPVEFLHFGPGPWNETGGPASCEP
jgi:hypothetical protein